MHAQHATEGISIRVLGPQIILRYGEEVPPPAPQQRRVLAVLASRPGEVVAREAISQRIWGSATAQQLRSLQSYVSHLRTVLGTHAIELVGSGYRLNLDEDRIDEVQFRRHVETGLEQVGEGHVRDARRHLEAALDLYRGKPYDDLPNGEFAVRACCSCATRRRTHCSGCALTSSAPRRTVARSSPCWPRPMRIIPTGSSARCCTPAPSPWRGGCPRQARSRAISVDG